MGTVGHGARAPNDPVDLVLKLAAVSDPLTYLAQQVGPRFVQPSVISNFDFLRMPVCRVDLLLAASAKFLSF